MGKKKDSQGLSLPTDTSPTYEGLDKHPSTLIELGKLYPKVKEQYESTLKLLKEAVKERFMFGKKLKEVKKERDELLEACQMVMDYIKYPYTHKGTTRIRKAVEKAIKSIEND
ncbi:MAG: hypothetical protein COA65_08625 [Rhodospirillaceae bacterium]|nr:MAG: hypothetical protein COA65_08625 [Rhodospirillaceae bacterium]